MNARRRPGWRNSYETKGVEAILNLCASIIDIHAKRRYTAIHRPSLLLFFWSQNSHKLQQMRTDHSEQRAMATQSRQNSSDKDSDSAYFLLTPWFGWLCQASSSAAQGCLSWEDNSPLHHFCLAHDKCSVCIGPSFLTQSLDRNQVEKPSSEGLH